MKADNISSNIGKVVTRNNNQKKKVRIKDSDLEIPKFSQFEKFNNINYPVSFLKIICKNFKLKLSGNKPNLKTRIYDFLVQSNNCILIQKTIRGYLLRLDYKLRGEALSNRSLCMNSSDFFTLENISDIPKHLFFSYKYNKNIWGFNIISIYNLFIRSENDVLNPYTREKISYKIFSQIKQLLKLNKIFNNRVNTIINKDMTHISIKKKIELKCLELFQHIDELGHYTDIQWYLSLNRFQLIKFIKELMDIWDYRLNLEPEVKKEICHPYGDPFRYANIEYLSNLAYVALQKAILYVIERFIKTGINRVSCNLGATYVLMGLTLVNQEAATALPWLYQSLVQIV
jgi:hypothetical protein